MPPTETRTICRRRLASQGLAGNPLATPEAAVRWMGAVQAQDYAGAKWGIAQRTPGATNAEIDRLCDEGAILRTHVLRPTWHFVTPEDIRWLLNLTAPRVHRFNAFVYRSHALDETVFARANGLIEAALRGRGELTRDELAGALRAGGIEAAGVRLVCIMMFAELEGLICSGARRGRQATYALLDERVPAASQVERADALAELARRYFASHGPATAQDFAWWSGLAAADVRAGIEAAGAGIQREEIDGGTYWSSGEIDGCDPQPPMVHLLPNYDELIVAYKDRSANFDSELTGRRNRPVDALTENAITLDGRVIGRWRRTLRRAHVALELTLHRRLDDAESAALDAAAERYGRFLELPVMRA